MPYVDLFDAARFEKTLRGARQPITVFKAALKHGNAYLEGHFRSGIDAKTLVRSRAWLIDQLLVRAYELGQLTEQNCALLAVGGYGRGELHPGSDIDLAIIVGGRSTRTLNRQIEAFLTFLWDIGLEVGHSVRTVRQCQQLARADITVATNLMEARLLAGDPALLAAVVDATGPARTWPTHKFFRAKLDEQIARHHKYHDTAYNLEPNIKEGPGGLRDIQTIGWVAKRHFGAQTLHDLVAHGFLTESEFQALDAGQDFLWRIRWALHILTGRREDRLLFDHQREVAQLFGCVDANGHLGVEQFMKMYYRTVMELSRLNEMLLGIFEEAILLEHRRAKVRPINKRFQIRNDYIEVCNPRVFQRYPFALLELFLLMQQNPEIRGVRASTIRLIRENLKLIDQGFRDDLRVRSLFMEIIRQPRRLGHELSRMHRYGVLAAYLPVFGKVVGVMQYDLFHAYTVDEHTLFVVRNLRRFWFPGPQDNLPLCTEIAADLPKPELLYLAGLFHDIAKGRGGDHSVLGERDATDFCRHHGLSAYDTRLVAWLVRHHLSMSRTAQRKDTSDPEVVNEFARFVGDRVHLNYLYLLTVADVRGTNPAIWNSWKDALLADLYRSTLRALRRGLERPIDKQERINETENEVLGLLCKSGIERDRIVALWHSLGEDYFLRHRPDEIAWHTLGIANCHDDDLPLVLIRRRSQRGGTEVFVYTRDSDGIFAATTNVFDQMGITVQDARIIQSAAGYTLHTYIVLEAANGGIIESEERAQEIVATVRARLIPGASAPRPVTRRLNRQLRHFSVPTRIVFSADEQNARTVMEVIGTDRPGFLSRVAMAMQFCGVRLQGAKIATFGERVEDVFFITDFDDQPIQDPLKFECLRNTLTESLRRA